MAAGQPSDGHLTVARQSSLVVGQWAWSSSAKCPSRKLHKKVQGRKNAKHAKVQKCTSSQKEQVPKTRAECWHLKYRPHGMREWTRAQHAAFVPVQPLRWTHLARTPRNECKTSGTGTHTVVSPDETCAARPRTDRVFSRVCVRSGKSVVRARLRCLCLVSNVG